MANINAHIDDYIAKAPEPAGPILTKIRALATELVPSAIETISYQMPAFRDGKIFLYFAAFKNHIGLYPPLAENSELVKRIAPYRGPKGNLKFSYGEEIPYGLIAEVIKALHQQYTSKK